MIVDLTDAAATERLGQAFGAALQRLSGGLVVTLAGELGAGKTALVRAVLAGLGHRGPVVSPSYTLVEPYALAHRTLYHMDLYRLGDPEELEFLGIRDIDPTRDLLFVEWAENGAGFLPTADLALSLAYRDTGRRMTCRAEGQQGRRALAALAGPAGR